MPKKEESLNQVNTTLGNLQLIRSSCKLQKNSNLVNISWHRLQHCLYQFFYSSPSPVLVQYQHTLAREKLHNEMRKRLTGSFLPFSVTLTPLQEPATSYALRVRSATISLSSFSILNLVRSGWNVTQVKSSPSKNLILGSEVLLMLFCHVWGR